VSGVLFFRTLWIWFGKWRDLGAHFIVKGHEVAVFARDFHNRCVWINFARAVDVLN